MGCGKCLQGYAGATDQFVKNICLMKRKIPLTVYVEMACNHRFGIQGDDGLAHQQRIKCLN